jgi:hypothetical protein
VIEDVTWFYFPIAYIGVILLVFAARGIRSLIEARGGLITISYPDRRVRAPRGLTVLEASLRFKVPHASVCGGKARPRPRRQRPLGAAAAVRPRIFRAGARRRERQSVDSPRLPAPPQNRYRGHSGAARQYRRRFRAQPPARQYRRRALRGQHVCRHARLDQAC